MARRLKFLVLLLILLFGIVNVFYLLKANLALATVSSPVSGPLTPTPTPTVCNLTVQASLFNSSTQSVNPGGTVQNQLVLTNPNPASCGANTYIYSRSYPYGWTFNIQNSVTINGGETQSVSFSLSVSANATPAVYDYSIIAYNVWADGSGQAQVTGYVKVLDKVSPNVVLTNPTNGSYVAAGSTVTLQATASDAGSGINRVVFHVNGTHKCTDYNSPYSCSWLVPQGVGITYTLTAWAIDNAGNKKSHSISVTSQ